MHYQFGDVWVLGLPHASWQEVQPVIRKFCAVDACYAVLNYVPASQRFMYEIPGQHLHVPKPHWFIYSAVDSAWLGLLDESCPVQHADAYCLHFMQARGDAFWSHARVARLRTAFDKAGITADVMECWPVAPPLGESGAHDHCASLANATSP